MTTAFITHPDCFKHDMGAYHPEQPARLSAIEDQMIASGIAGLVERYDAPRAAMTELTRVHPEAYVDSIYAASPEHGIAHLDPDTAMCPYTWDAALHAAGAGVLATDLVISQGAANAFCSVRPPGHHATRIRAMGFCFFNNIAVAAMHALEHHGLSRIAIVDFDVHHGNGTEEIFSDDERVVMVGTFQHPFYPYSGAEDAARNILNVPLPAGSGGQALRQAVEQVWLPALEAHQPEMLFISAGFDAHVEDDMAGLRFTEADYAWVTAQLKDVAARHASGRIVSMLEGGYALSALGRSVVAHIRVLSGL
ncbi:MAG: histone deacetylase family protein [Betaproteobacteria bacterium]|nr:histone deacetylase family protein [Betaproteobacteria bacterium]